MRNWFGWVMGLVVVLVGCSPMDSGSIDIDSTAVSSSPLSAPTQPITIFTAPLSPTPGCTDSFATRTLPHTTQVHGEAVRMFETNGSGVAVNDLDGDGYLDMVFANLNGSPSIFWNDGGLSFRQETLADNGTRAVNVVDVDGNGRLDIVFTHVKSSLSLWQNQLGADGMVTFVHKGIPGVLKQAHSMAWGDLNGDGRLDLVTGSYDAELHRELGDAFLFSGGVGVYSYLQEENGRFSPQRLAEESQALTIALVDVSGDGQRDIVVGNDFDFPDQVWFNNGAAGWEAAAPFAHTSHSTMSLDWGDVDNNGRFELFSTDMNPYDISVENMARWLPMMDEMPHRIPNDDPQLTQNVLQVWESAADEKNGRFANRAPRQGIAASGWSWSGKFGDLDNDGHLDLYVVNGMIDSQLFAYLPNNELVEENQAFRNTGRDSFDLAPEWGMGSTASGRGLVLADLDNDGDLDAVINNLLSPAQLLENQLCGGQSIEIDLRWPGSPNSHALGAQLRLVTSDGTQWRDVRSGSGYLSGDATRIHFGFADDAVPAYLEIIWPDGAVSLVETITPDTLITVVR
ncbi:MAG: VCBS repeat-containing protein [Ardenticatenaceae bacterium]|nr:VCBS repeat-containing protein [Ardenticatenaceae bacterium]